jgi:glycosyltransferase involved in cell wall biosynthesis
MHKVNTVTESNITCTVIMPIYNRLAFLNQAFTSLARQTFQNWRLIIVDDGSSDEPFPLIEQLAKPLKQPVYYIVQANAGPGAARQTGINASPACDYFAFFDSDDQWLPDYLDDAISCLNAYATIDWLYVACKRIQHNTGNTIQESTFWLNKNEPVKFLSLETTTCGNAHCFTNNQNVILEQLREPINAGFQNSVIRSRLFHTLKIPPYRIGEDRHLVICALARGFKLAYIDKANVIYHVHDNNISDTNSEETSYDKKLFVQQELLTCYEDLLSQGLLNKPLTKAMRNECANLLFWHIGYQVYAPQKQPQLAISNMFAALRYRPVHLKFYKTLFAYLIKLLLKR